MVIFHRPWRGLGLDWLKAGFGRCVGGSRDDVPIARVGKTGVGLGEDYAAGKTRKVARLLVCRV